MSAVLCLPACLCVSTAASCGQAPPRERVRTFTPTEGVVQPGELLEGVVSRLAGSPRPPGPLYVK